jgi:NAD(P)-dependent dehydrogenase (short-subunit alcohol dehydrogenase family)
LDVTDFAAIGPEGARAERDIGPIDVLVNSAGYGHEGTLEESPLEEMRRQFDVNVFGAVAMIKAVLPFMSREAPGAYRQHYLDGGICGISWYPLLRGQQIRS